MNRPTLQEISDRLESPDTKDRLLALTSLREIEPEDAVPLIKKVLYDEIITVRSMAVFALGVKGTEESYPLLVQLLEGDEDYGIRADAAGALGYLRDIRAFEPLVRAFYEDTSWLVRFSAAVSLGNLQDARAKQVLLEALDSGESLLRQAAISAIGEINAVEGLDRILEFAGDRDWLIRQRLAESLGNFTIDKSISALKFLAKDSHPQVSHTAVVSLQRIEQNLSHP
jgi:HEAT repeat protein